MRRVGFVLLLVLWVGAVASAETVTIEADRDATLIETVDGGRANGSGPYFFVGRTNQSTGSIRRALLRFDVAGTLPRRAIIESVSLTLYLWPSNPAPREIRLHRLVDEWGEGPSSSSGGGGRPSEPGDATWIHTFYDDKFWVRGGGQFVSRVGARQTIAGEGFYTWADSHQLVNDVRLWYHSPQRNFGWILIGDETTPQNAKSFVSREHPDLNLRPVLEVTYRVP